MTPVSDMETTAGVRAGYELRLRTLEPPGDVYVPDDRGNVMVALCRSAVVSQERLRDLLGDQFTPAEEIMTEATLTSGAAVAEVLEAFADALRKRSLEATAYWRHDPDESTCAISVIVPTWDAQLEDDIYDLMWLPEAQRLGVELDVSVYFKDSCSPDLGDFSRLV